MLLIGLVVGMPQAWADSWATGEWETGYQNTGSQGTINYQCLYTPSPGSYFATAELWQGTDNSQSGAYWVEEGAAYGAPENFTYYWFWADNRPSYGYAEHDITSQTPSINTNYAVGFLYIGSNEWQVIENGVVIGTSTHNPPDGNFLEAGGEHNLNPGGVTAGTASSLAYRWASNGNNVSGWAAFGSLPGTVTSGGSASWNSNYTTLTWNSGTCT